MKIPIYYSNPYSPRLSKKHKPLLRHRSTEFLKSGERWTNGGWRTVASVVYCMCQFLVAVPDAVLGPTLMALGEQVNCINHGEICPEMLEAIGWNRTGAALSVILAWILSPCINGHFILAMGFVLVSASFLGCPFSSNADEVHVYFFLIGLGKGLVSLNSTSLMVALRQGNQKKLSKWVNWLSISWGLGSIFTPLLVSLTSLKDFRLSFFAVGVLCFSMSTTVCYVRYKVPDREHFPSTYRQPLKGLSSWRAHIIMILGYLFVFVSVGVEFNIVAYITPYIESRHIGSNVLGNLMTSSYSFAFMIGRIMSGYLESAGLPVVVILNGCMLAATGTAVLVAYFPTSISAIWAAAIGWGMFLSPSWPCTLIMLRQTGPLSEAMVQVFVFVIYCGQWALDLVMDRIIQRFGTQALPFGLLSALGTAFSIILLINFIYYCHFSEYSLSPLKRKRVRFSPTAIKASARKVQP